MKPTCLALAGALLATAPIVRAQEDEEPPPDWQFSVGAGFAVTSGNSDTKNVNASFDVVYDPTTRNVFKADGLWLRRSTDGDLSADRSALGARYEYRFSGRTFAFAEGRYQRDRFKELSYLLTSLAGIGHHLVDADGLRLTVDASVGGGFEKLFDDAATADGTFKFGEALRWQISKTAKLTHSAWGLWKFSDTSDSYFHVDLALATRITSFLELELSVVDDFKNRPADEGIEKNDLAFLVNLSLTL